MSSSVGVGYSYADYGETVETTEDAARNVHAFITIFFETFSEFSGRPIHLSGESYGVSDTVVINIIGYFYQPARRDGTYQHSQAISSTRIRLQSRLDSPRSI